MEHDLDPSEDTNLAAHAFGELRAEISLLRRAVERLTDARTSQPDYAPSPEAISKRLEDVVLWARKVSERPAIKLTPRDLEQQIAAAPATSRVRDLQALEDARGAMQAANDRIDATIARSWSVADQDQEIQRNRIASGVAGMTLWSILPGAVARSLPVSWAVSEPVAAWMLGTDMWNAGDNMMARADPERWGRTVAHERKRLP